MTFLCGWLVGSVVRATVAVELISLRGLWFDLIVSSSNLVVMNFILIFYLVSLPLLVSNFP